ncbi:unnamed protein product, partial [Mesorhabditis belari]|uniref:Uncharacterized protein n=1 Tax=Mesorhabditis belari TaxID=2138241 RepID=A0AAF3ESG1_9BILA
MGIPEEDRLILGLIYASTSISSLFLNLLILAVLCKIYTFNSSLFWASTWFPKIETLPQKGVIVFLLIASLHRLYLFVYPQMEAYCFREYASIIWRFLGWVYIILNTFSADFIGCSRVFSYQSYYYYWICEPTPIAEFYIPMIQMENYMCLVVILFLLITIYFYAKILKKSVQYNKKGFHEKNVLLQNLIFIENVLEILICNIHPISYLLFNRKVRNHLKRLACLKNRGGGKFQRNSRYISPVPTSNYVSYEQLCQPASPLQPPTASRVLRNRQQAKLISTRSV